MNNNFQVSPKNPPLNNRNTFADQLKSMKKGVLVGHLIVTEDGNLAGTHLFKKLWEIFKTTLGFSDHTSDKEIRKATLKFLTENEDYITTVDFDSIKILISRVTRKRESEIDQTTIDLNTLFVKLFPKDDQRPAPKPLKQNTINQNPNAKSNLIHHFATQTLSEEFSKDSADHHKDSINTSLDPSFEEFRKSTSPTTSTTAILPEKANSVSKSPQMGFLSYQEDAAPPRCYFTLRQDLAENDFKILLNQLQKLPADIGSQGLEFITIDDDFRMKTNLPHDFKGIAIFVQKHEIGDLDHTPFIDKLDPQVSDFQLAETHPGYDIEETLNILLKLFEKSQWEVQLNDTCITNMQEIFTAYESYIAGMPYLNGMQNAILTLKELVKP